MELHLCRLLLRSLSSAGGPGGSGQPGQGAVGTGHGATTVQEEEGMSYKSELGRTWWLKNPAFKAYMLREATVLPLVFFILCMLAGIYSLGKGEQAWQSWVVVMGNPLVLTLNALALVASLYHAATFFVLFPRVMPVRLGGQKVPDNLIVIAQWAGVAAVFMLAAWVFWGVL